MQSSEFICPVSGLEMSGHHHFAFLRSCGCVLSEKALKEVPSETCHKCGKGYKKDDIIIINGTEEDITKQTKAMEERKRSAKLNKQSKRKAESQHVEKVNSDDNNGSSSNSTEGMEALTPAGLPKLPKLPDPASLPKIPDPEVESALVEKRPKLTAAGKGKCSAGISLGQSTKKVNGDIESHKAYRSMFTSSAPACSKEQSSHWVTFFPYH